ncbi:MAG: pentapeptide repeat-containing protein [Gammaproteobacteria bacterium]
MRNPLLWVVICLSLAVLFGGYCIWHWLSDNASNSEAARSLALSVGGIWAIYAVYLSAERVQIMQQQQLSESLAKAAEQLSSKMPSIRILAIRTLKNIALDTTDVRVCQDVVSVLCHYVRDNSPINDQTLDLGLKPDSHIEEAVRALSAINSKRHEDAVDDLNLFKANLSGLDLSSVNLAGADLRLSDLSRANLSEANLSYASLFRTKLIKSDLRFANLTKARLIAADLSSAKLSGAVLSQSNVMSMIVDQTDFKDVHFDGVAGISLPNMDRWIKAINLPPEVIGKMPLGAIVQKMKESGSK